MKRKALLMCATIIILVTAVISTPSLSLAGTNGQQLRLDVWCQYAPALAEIRVRGKNQRGDLVTWYAAPNARGVSTTGWWWVGNVDISFRFAGINPYTKSTFPWYGRSAYIPTQFNRDFFPVAVDWYMDCTSLPSWVK